MFCQHFIPDSPTHSKKRRLAIEILRHLQTSPFTRTYQEKITYKKIISLHFFLHGKKKTFQQRERQRSSGLRKKAKFSMEHPFFLFIVTYPPTYLLIIVVNKKEKKGKETNF